MAGRRRPDEGAELDLGEAPNSPTENKQTFTFTDCEFPILSHNHTNFTYTTASRGKVDGNRDT